MRAAVLALLLAGAAGAQPTLDVAGGGGLTLVGLGVEDGAGLAAPFGTAAVAVTPSGDWRWIRPTASILVLPGGAGARAAALGVGAEVPLFADRNGPFLTAGVVAIRHVADDPIPCAPADGCFGGGTAVPSYTGLAWAVGLGARVPAGDRMWVEPQVSALAWGDTLPSARLALGWRLR